MLNQIVNDDRDILLTYCLANIFTICYNSVGKTLNFAENQIVKSALSTFVVCTVLVYPCSFVLANLILFSYY
uniref:Uncharacterized protein n=1 Tax=Pararge aegeria TaxID=116150 RepID=S4NXA5_9NEOP